MKDNSLFIGTVNSGLLDTRKYQKQIMNYYKMHKDSINPEGIIQEFVDEAYSKKHKKRWKLKTKKQIEEEKIKRLRANDKLKQEALENKLLQELKEKKN